MKDADGYDWTEHYESDANGNMAMEIVPSFDINEKGNKVWNLSSSEANASWFKAARLLELGTPEALAELKAMNDAPMMRPKKKTRVAK
jgi:hypothetical protein